MKPKLQSVIAYTDWTRGREQVLYAITDGRTTELSEASAQTRLLEMAAVWAENGVTYVQLREKDLSSRAQVELARAMLQAMRIVAGERRPRLLINGRPDVALAAGADGVHLPAGTAALMPEEVRHIFAAAGRTDAPVISVSCHTLREVEAARKQAPDCILFAPVFEKVILRDEVGLTAMENRAVAQKLPGTGLALLQQAGQLAAPVPVFALGGVTAENARECLRVGAAGIAAIRLLQEPASVWRHLA